MEAVWPYYRMTIVTIRSRRHRNNTGTLLTGAGTLPTPGRSSPMGNGVIPRTLPTQIYKIPINLSQIASVSKVPGDESPGSRA